MTFDIIIFYCMLSNNKKNVLPIYMTIKNFWLKQISACNYSHTYILCKCNSYLTGNGGCGHNTLLLNIQLAGLELTKGGRVRKGGRGNEEARVRKGGGKGEREVDAAYM